MNFDFIAVAETLEAQAAALRRHAATLAREGQAELPLPGAEAHPWNDWLGGEGPPPGTSGKLVDIILEGTGDTIQTGPADIWAWQHADADHIGPGEIKRYRISEEQPEAC